MRRVILLLFSSILMAKDVNITKDLKSITIKDGDKKIKIERIQDTKHRLTSSFTKTSRECPPYCVQPMRIGKVRTIGELELLRYIEEMQDEDSNMLLIDARTRDWYAGGSIPGSINLPFTMLKKDSKYLPKILKLLGAKRDSRTLNYSKVPKHRDSEAVQKWDFSEVPKMIIYSNGIWDAQATEAIKSLLALGCPEDKILYYRGGMQNWYILGLTTK